MYIDTHCHLTDEIYHGAEDIIADFAADGIAKVITVGYDLPSSTDCVALSDRYQKVYAAIGVHPSDAMSYCDDTERELEKLAHSQKVVCFGEIGLDYHYEDIDCQVQKTVFVRQLKLADQLGLPVTLHVRDAYGDALELLRQNAALLKRGGIMHCYSGSAEQLPDFLNLGLHVSFSGSITFKNNRKADTCIAVVPKNRILTETDCPYLTPTPHRGEVNFPKYVKLIAEKIADVYEISVDSLNEIVAKNVRELFGI